MKMIGGTGIIGQDMACGFGKGIKVELRKDIDLTNNKVGFMVNETRTTFVFPCKENKKYKITKILNNPPANVERFKIACVDYYPQANENFKILFYKEYYTWTTEIIFTIPESGKYLIVMLGNPYTDRIKIKVKEVS